MFSKITALVDEYKSRSNFDWNYAVKILYTTDQFINYIVHLLFIGEEDEK